MPDYLLDTNHVTHLLGGTEALRRRIEAASAAGQKFSIAMTVLGELFYAAYASQRREDNLTALRAFMTDIVVWPYDEEAAEEFGRIQAEQKARGRPIPRPWMRKSPQLLASIRLLSSLPIATSNTLIT